MVLAPPRDTNSAAVTPVASSPPAFAMSCGIAADAARHHLRWFAVAAHDRDVDARLAEHQCRLVNAPPLRVLRRPRR